MTMKMMCTTNIIDPDSGEILQWEGRVLSDDEANWAWELATEYPMSFTIEAEQNIVKIGMRSQG